MDPRKQTDVGQVDVSDLFQQITNVAPFGEMLVNEPVELDLRKFQSDALLQKLDEHNLKTALYNHVGEVRGFTDQQILDAIARYTQISNQSRLDMNGKQVRIDRSGVRIVSPHGNSKPTDEPLKKLLPKRRDLQGLPFVMGNECRLNEKDTRALDTISRELGTAISRFNFFGSLPTFAVSKRSGVAPHVQTISPQQKLRHQSLCQTIRSIEQKVTKRNKSVSGLVQMLQADNPMIRYELLKNLDKINTGPSIEALAKRAIHDLSPEVRGAAIEFLEDHPRKTSRKVFLDAFNYPWSPVAQHSAEALVRLKDTDAIPELVELIDRPDPSLPFKNKNGQMEIREVVAVNHMKNCMLCHAPSTHASDSLRGLMPSPGKPLPRQYYQSMSGGFVRADVTYLTQDFSVTQPVPDSGPWPEMQRFDYLVRQRPLTGAERTEWKTNGKRKLARHRNLHRGAVLFALRELTGKFPENDDVETWREIAKEFAER